MSLAVKQNRSYRVASGDDPDAVAEAAGSDADAVLLDLEDSVPLDAESKGRARERVSESLESDFADTTQYTTVRINGLGSEWAVRDIRALAAARPGPDSVCLPKVRSSTEPRLVAELLSQVDSSMGVIVIVEHATAVFNLQDIVRSTPRLDALIFGSVDYRRSVGMPVAVSRESNVDTAAQKYVPRVLVSTAASAAGVAAVDGGYYRTDDPDGLRADALTARNLGFDGKAASTAGHVSILNETFGPSEQELDEARRIVEAFDEAGDVAKLEVDGVIVERSHYEQQRALLERAAETDN